MEKTIENEIQTILNDDFLLRKMEEEINWLIYYYCWGFMNENFTVAQKDKLIKEVRDLIVSRVSEPTNNKEN